MRKSLFFLIILLLAAGSVILWQRGETPLAAERYRSVKVERGDIEQTVSANGTLNPVVLVNVGTQVSGTIRRLYADFNDRVQAGQVLAELDPPLFEAAVGQSQANLASAEAQLRLAQANLKRTEALFKQDYVARADLDQSRQALEAAQAQVAAAHAQVKRDRTNLGYSVIHSPVSGVVVSRAVDVGQTVAASFQTPTLFSIAQDLQRMQIDTTVAEADVGGIRVGQAVRFTVDAFPDRTFAGKVRLVRLDSKVQQNVVTYDVVIEVENREEILLPGMTAFVNVVVAERRGVLRLPMAALRFRPGKETPPVRPGEKTVYGLENGKPVPVTVRLGSGDGKFAEILGDGLKDGDSVVVEDLEQNKKVEAPGTAPPGGAFRTRLF